MALEAAPGRRAGRPVPETPRRPPDMPGARPMWLELWTRPAPGDADAGAHPPGAPAGETHPRKRGPNMWFAAASTGRPPAEKDTGDRTDDRTSPGHDLVTQTLQLGAIATGDAAERRDTEYGQGRKENEGQHRDNRACQHELTITVTGPVGSDLRTLLWHTWLHQHGMGATGMGPAPVKSQYAFAVGQGAIVMARKPREQRGSMEHQRELAALIDRELRAGQFHDPDNKPSSWTNEAFAAATGNPRTGRVGMVEGSVRNARDPAKPPPGDILPFLRVFYGDVVQFRVKRIVMDNLWRRATGRPLIDPDDGLHGPRTIVSKRFGDDCPVIDLQASQPHMDDNRDLIVPYTLRIHPVTEYTNQERTVEIGVREAWLGLSSDHWRPEQRSIFRGHPHENIRDSALTGSARITGPLDKKGRIDGRPLGEAPSVRLEPLSERDGPVTLAIHVPRRAFVVTPNNTDAPNATIDIVLDAIFAEAFARGPQNSMTVASELIATPRSTERE